MAALFASGNKSSRNLFALQKGLLKSVGISVEETQSLSYRLYSLSVLFLMVTLPFVQIRTAMMYIQDIEMVAEILMYPLFTVIVLMKIAVILKNRGQLRSLLEKFEEEVFIPNVERGGEMEKQWLNNCTLTANKLVKVCAILITAITIILPTVTWGMSLSAPDCNDWQFTFGPILNVTCTPYIYPMSVYQIVVISYCGYVYVFIYFLFISVMMHLRCHFKILQNALKGMVNYAKRKAFEKERFLSINLMEKDPSWIPLKYLQTTLKEIVTYHDSILNVAQGFKNMFSPILLILFLSDLLLLGYMMNLTLECPTESAKCTRGVLCYVVLISLLFVVCYWGNEINFESEAVARVCGAIDDVVGVNPKFQKSLVLMIQRGQEPIVFTAGGFIDLSLDSFTQILRGSYSYFMLLYNAKNK